MLFLKQVLCVSLLSKRIDSIILKTSFVHWTDSGRILLLLLVRRKSP